MTGLSEHGVTDMLTVGNCLELASWVVRIFLVMLASCAALLGSLILVARIIHAKTLNQLKGLPQIRQQFPFQSMWIIQRACNQPGSRVGFGTMIFAAVRGFHAIFQRFGRYIIFVGFRPMLVLYKAEYVEEVLSSNKILFKGNKYELLHSWLGTGLLTSAGEKWRSRRRLFTPAFHFRILDDFMGTINAQSFILTTKLEKLSAAGHKFDVVPVVTMCTLDIICETIMGTTIHAQSNENNPYLTAVNRLAEIFMERVFTPLLQVNFIFELTSKGREYKKCLKVLHTFTRKVIAERKEALRNEIEAGLITLEEDAPPTDVGRMTPRPFMDLLLIEHFKGNITDDGIREEGHDTTAVGISWALFLIGHYAEKQHLIHDELDFIFGDDRDRYVTSEDLKQMKYLECALKESQRIYPSAPMISRLCTEPFTTGGVTLPKNSVVQVGTYFLHRDAKVFPRPEEFVPERFLPENAKGRHPYAYVPFAAGPRNCIGQKFALAEEKIAIANVLRRFKIKSLDQRDEVALAAEIVLRPRSGLRIEFTPR